MLSLDLLATDTTIVSMILLSIQTVLYNAIVLVISTESLFDSLKQTAGSIGLSEFRQNGVYLFQSKRRYIEEEVL